MSTAGDLSGVRQEYEDFLPPLIFNEIFTFIDHKIMLYSFDRKTVVKDESEIAFHSVDLDETIYLSEDSLPQIVKFRDKYYFIAITGHGNGRFSEAIFETDLDTYVSKIFQSSFEIENLEKWKYISKKNNDLYLISSSKNGNVINYGTAKSYLVNLNDNSLEQVWERNNFNIQEPLHLEAGYVFSHTLEIGVEPWKIDLATDNPLLLKDFNTDLKTRTSGLRNKFSSTNRALLDYLIFYDVYEDTGYHFSKSTYASISHYGARVTDMYFKPVKIDDRYDYFERFNGLLDGTLESIDTLVYDFREKNFVLLDKIVLMGEVYNGKTISDKGYLVYLFSDRVLFRGVDQDKSVNLNFEHSNIDAVNDHIVAAGFHEASNSLKLSIIDQEFNTQELSFDCQITPCEISKTAVINDSLLIVTGSGNNSQAYILPSVTEDEVFQLDIESLDENVFSAALANKDYLIYSTNTGSATNIYKYNFRNGQKIILKERNFFLNTGNQIDTIYSIESGNYFVTQSMDGILIFDKELNLTSDFSRESIQGMKDEYALECHQGYCYLQGDRGFSVPSDERYFQIKFDINGNLVELINSGMRIFAGEDIIAKHKNELLVSAHTERYGTELFKLTIDNSGFDADADGIPDGYETIYGFDPRNSDDAEIDSDNDGLNNREEFLNRTSPLSSDTDNDGLSDGDEVSMGFEPLEYDLHYRDKDNDGLSYRLETHLGTNPLNNDTDGDGHNDKDDLFPLDVLEYSDNDLDGIGDNADTDDDNDDMPDDWEEQFGLDPLSASDRNTDLDNDGVSNYDEYQAGTDPTVANNSGGGSGSGGGTNPPPTSPPSSSGGGGGSTSLLLLLMMLPFAGRRYYR